MNRLLIAAALFAAAAPARAIDAGVYVKDAGGNPLSGISVYAIHFTTFGPDPILSTGAVTDNNGFAAFYAASGTALTANMGFDVVAGTQNYVPSIRDQFNDPSHAFIWTGAAFSTPTITLTALPNSFAQVNVDVIHATPNALLMANVIPNGGGGADTIAYGIARSNGAGTATMQIYDVPFVGSFQENVGAFDPYLNRSAGRTVDVALDQTHNPYYSNAAGKALDLTASNALPPSSTVNQAQQNNGSGGGGLSLDAVVMDTASAAGIPWIGTQLQGQYVAYGSTYTDNRWAQADQNGHIQVYGLQAGVTYYMTVLGGCDYNRNLCFTGYTSTAGLSGSFGAAPAANDFVYPSTTTVVTEKILLNQAPPSNGTIAVYLKDNLGNPLAGAQVMVGADNQGWDTGNGCAYASTATVSNPGLASLNAYVTTGYFLATGLPSGNYRVSAWTQFNSNGQFSYNDGADGQPCWQNGGNCQCGTDDLRVTVDTTTSPDVKVYNSSGTLLFSGSSITITVPLQVSNSGVLQGTLTFPQSGVDLSNDPISITLQAQCFSMGCPSGAQAYFNSSSTGPTINYAIHISSGFAYWLQVRSNYWGVVQTGGNDNFQVDLTSSAAVTLNLTFARAGRVLGHLLKPDGSYFQPQNGQNSSYAWVSAEVKMGNGHGWAQVAQDGSFTIGGLVPGAYELRPEGSGSAFTYVGKTPYAQVNVTALKDTYQDAQLVNGIPVQIIASTATLPPIVFPNCALNPRGCVQDDYGAVAVPAGSVFSSPDVRDAVLFHMDSGATPRFTYITDPAHSWDCDGAPSAPGFCVTRAASPAAYDFYLMRTGDMSPEQGGGSRPFAVIYSSTRNIVVSDLTASTTYFFSGSTLTVRPVNLTPTNSYAGRSVGWLSGNVSGANIVRQQDFSGLGGSLENFIKFMPVVQVFDQNNNVVAFGLTVPAPSQFLQPLTIGATTQPLLGWFEQSITNSDYSLFQTVWQNFSSGFGYEIRGVSTGTYTAIITTPNYPPCQASVSLTGATTAYANFNLDSCAGAGATITGVVQSTMAVAIPNASVTVQADNYPARTVTTNASGAFSAPGLPNGAFTVTVNASGYAPGKALVNVSAAGTYTQNMQLQAGGASIRGTVYAAKVPFVQVQPGAQVLAYDDTINSANPNAELTVFKTVTSSAGVYQFDNLIIGDTFKLFVKVDGFYVLQQTTTTINGLRSGLDFTLQRKPLDVQVSGRPNAALNVYEFKVDNPKDFASGRAWISTTSGAGFTFAVSTEVTNGFMKLPNNQLLLDYGPLTGVGAVLTAGQDYTLHIEAVSLAGNKVTKEILFGTARRASAQKQIDAALLGDDSDDGQGHKNNQALLDATGDNPSALSLPAGAVIPVSTNAVPTVQFSQTDVSASTVAALVNAVGSSTGAFASGIYQITLSSVNYTAKGVDITLAYDKGNANLGDLSLQHFNSGTNKWEQVPGTQTIDPVKGTVTIRRLKSLTSVLGLRNGHPLLAVTNGHSYSPSAVAAAGVLIPDDSGSFAIIRPSFLGATYGGTALKVFNFPNPFNLNPKNVPIANGGATTQVATNGTIIKSEIPSGMNGQGTIRIYTVSGELVRELDLGSVTGGNFYYTAWDGKNFRGVDVANGVYFGVLSVPGGKAKDGRFKLAVIK